MFATAVPTLADTGSVYFDAQDNAAAGDTNGLFNATFTGHADCAPRTAARRGRSRR